MVGGGADLLQFQGSFGDISAVHPAADFKPPLTLGRICVHDLVHEPEITDSKARLLCSGRLSRQEIQVSLRINT